MDYSTWIIPAGYIALMAAVSISVRLHVWHKEHWTPLAPYLLRYILPKFCVFVIFLYGSTLPVFVVNPFGYLGRFGFFILLLPDNIQAIWIITSFLKRRIKQ